MECDWLMRPADPWDKDLPAHLARENQTLQALRDALTFARSDLQVVSGGYDRRAADVSRRSPSPA